MKPDVYFIPIKDQEPDDVIAKKLKRVLIEKEFLNFIEEKDFVAVKTHFGENKSKGYVRPVIFRMLADLIKKRKALPFLTETSTLYRGRRSNAVDHLELAYDHGFTYDKVKMPIIMADGILGDNEVSVKIKGKIYKEVNIALEIVKVQSMVVVSHFTGHIVAGFGAALKNLGMGCSSRMGKLIQHSTAQPSVKKDKCTGCKECERWCPTGAIKVKEGKAEIDENVCIGCGECLAVCRFDAIYYNWGETYENLQKKIVEHAMGVMELKKDKIIFINFLNRITKECDCMNKYEKITEDIGVLISYDPVAIDSASFELVEEKSGKELKDMSFDIPNRVQLDYSEELNFGSKDYNLIDITSVF